MYIYILYNLYLYYSVKHVYILQYICIICKNVFKNLEKKVYYKIFIIFFAFWKINLYQFFSFFEKLMFMDMPV